VAAEGLGPVGDEWDMTGDNVVSEEDGLGNVTGASTSQYFWLATLAI